MGIGLKQIGSLDDSIPNVSVLTTAGGLYAFFGFGSSTATATGAGATTAMGVGATVATVRTGCSSSDPFSGSGGSVCLRLNC